MSEHYNSTDQKGSRLYLRVRTREARRDTTVWKEYITDPEGVIMVQGNKLVGPRKSRYGAHMLPGFRTSTSTFLWIKSYVYYIITQNRTLWLTLFNAFVHAYASVGVGIYISIKLGTYVHPQKVCMSCLYVYISSQGQYILISESFYFFFPPSFQPFLLPLSLSNSLSLTLSLALSLSLSLSLSLFHTLNASHSSSLHNIQYRIFALSICALPLPTFN